VAFRLAITGGRPKSRKALGLDPFPSRPELVAFHELWVALDADVLIHGDADGTDRYVADRAEARGIAVDSYPATEELDGPWPGAGPRRNRRMLVQGGAQGLAAFPGGRGTADAIRAAGEMSLPVWKWCSITRKFRPLGEEDELDASALFQVSP